MITLTVSSQCVLHGADAQTAAAILKLLRVKNPDYIKAQRYGGGARFMSEWLCLAEKLPDGSIVFPREARAEVMPLIPDAETVDNRMKLPPVEFNEPAIGMRDYQAAAINIIAMAGGGIIEVPCGGGKTNIAHGAVARLKQPTLWLTHKKDLLEQSMERAVQLLGLQIGEIGTITEGKMKLGSKITFATVQTMANLPDAQLDILKPRYGLVIVDECHRCVDTPKAMMMFARCINAMPARYRVGITATAKREDGMDRTMKWLLGKVIYSLPHEVLEEKGHIIIPTVRKVSTQFDYVQTDVKLDFNDLLTAMTTDPDLSPGRNRQVLDLICNIAPCSHALVLTARVEHATDLTGWLRTMAPEASVEMVCGSTKMAERERIYDAVRRGVCRVLVATYELAKEGLDMPVLDALVLATPVKNATMVEQSMGRIMRACEGKTGAVVWDITDQRVTTLRRQWAARKKVYEKLGCKIEEMNRK